MCDREIFVVKFTVWIKLKSFSAITLMTVFVSIFTDLILIEMNVVKKLNIQVEW